LAEIYTHHGIAYAQGGMGGQPQPDLNAAATYFRRALQVKPIFEAYANLAGVCNQLGLRSKNLGDYAEAEKAAKAAVELNAASGAAWNNLAIAQYYQNRQVEAVQTLRRAVQLAPGDAQILANLKALGG
jgi:Flp pilus assembly protein TadD